MPVAKVCGMRRFDLGAVVRGCAIGRMLGAANIMIPMMRAFGGKTVVMNVGVVSGAMNVKEQAGARYRNRR